MVPTALPAPALMGPIPGGPELLIIFVLFFMLLIPAAVFAAGVGVGWWLRGREKGEPSEPDRADGIDGSGTTDGSEKTD